MRTERDAFAWPTRVDEWTPETVRSVVERHRFERGVIEFKEVLNARDPEARRSLRRTVCSMANTDGGWILFGVTEEDVPDRIVGIPISPTWRKDFADKIQAIRPDVGFDASTRPIPIEGCDGVGNFVVRVPLSPLRPHMVEESDTKVFMFYRRGEGGSAEPMRRHEVRDQMLYSEERLRRLTLFRIELRTFRRVADLILAEGANSTVLNAADRFDTTTFSALLSDVVALLPDDTTLMDRFIDLRTAARRTNDVLDRYQRTNANPNWALDHVNSAITDVVNLAHRCGEELDTAFGPIDA